MAPERSGRVSRVELTEREVQRAQRTGKTYFVRDSVLKGFALRVTAAGSKAYTVEGRWSGRFERRTVGRPVEMSLKEARAAAMVVKSGQAGAAARRRIAQFRGIPVDRQLISIIDIADAHGKRKQSIHKLVKRLGIEVVKMKSNNARGQMISYITTRDYEELRRQLDKPDSPNSDTRTDGSGVIYLVQLEPEIDPGRFKIGFTTDPDERLRSHRTSAPFSELVKTWPSKFLWEKTAIDCITQDCEQLHTEVFRTQDFDLVIGRAERFFELMPTMLGKRDHNITSTLIAPS